MKETVIKPACGNYIVIQHGATFQHPLRSSMISLIASLSAVCLLSGFGDISHDKKYDCAGKNDNGMVSSREFPTLHFSGHQLRIAGSDIFSAYNYEICDESDTLVSFATHREICRTVPAEINSLGSSNGSFNRITGRLEIIGAQGLRGDYQCKETTKN